jgi:small subunit ribosomal protein S2
MEVLKNKNSRTTSVLLKKFITLGLHLGHNNKTLVNSKFLLGRRGDRSILDLEITIGLFQRSLRFLQKINKKSTVIWWVGTNGRTRPVLKKIALATLESEEDIKSTNIFLTRSWIPGLLTNESTFQSITRRFVQNNNLLSAKFEPKEKLLHDPKTLRNLNLSFFRQRKKGNRFLDFLSIVLQGKGLFNTPDLIIIINPKENKVALEEAHFINIPTIGFVDSDFNSANVTYPIPIRDDNSEGLIFCCDFFLKALEIQLPEQAELSLKKRKSLKQKSFNRTYWSKVKKEHLNFHSLKFNRKVN